MPAAYILQVDANYKEEIKRYVFFNLEIAQSHMRTLWQEVQNTLNYDPQLFVVSVRFSNNIIFEETYFEEDNALVTWREHSFHQWIRFSIVEGECLEEGGRAW